MSETVSDKPAKLDDVLLAMDVVDTLRHRKRIVENELNAEDREAALVARLQQIYTAQGIEVPDRILREGVKALDEQRFVYTPPKNSFSVFLAKIYIARGRWMAPVLMFAGLLIFLSLAYEFAVERPRIARAERIQIELSETLPAEFERLRSSVAATAETDDVRTRAQALYSDGVALTQRGDRDGARDVLAQFQMLEADLRAEYEVRVVSRPGEYSGVFRIPDGARRTRNFYLIVEARDSQGRPVDVTIESEEDQKTRRVSIWGQRVPEAVFNRVAADKQDDQIIQDAVIGRKRRGQLTPEYNVDVLGGTILEW